MVKIRLIIDGLQKQYIIILIKLETFHILYQNWTLIKKNIHLIIIVSNCVLLWYMFYVIVLFVLLLVIVNWLYGNRDLFQETAKLALWFRDNSLF